MHMYFIHAVHVLAVKLSAILYTFSKYTEIKLFKSILKCTSNVAKLKHTLIYHNNSILLVLV